MLSSNGVKSGFLKPSYNETFPIQPSLTTDHDLGRPILSINEAKIPLLDTVDIAAVLDEIKSKVWRLPQKIGIILM